MLEAELRESACILDLPSADIGFLDQRSPACDLMKQNSSIVSRLYLHKLNPFQA